MDKILFDENISRESAMQRVKTAGYEAGKWGSKPESNPYARSPSMHEEASAWASGWLEGSAERKRGGAK